VYEEEQRLVERERRLENTGDVVGDTSDQILDIRARDVAGEERSGAGTNIANTVLSISGFREGRRRPGATSCMCSSMPLSAVLISAA
jgi:hypothetical protein